jgi:hypothetical protein
MTIYSKPYQEAVQMIREGLDNVAADATQGPLLLAALRSLLDLPYQYVTVAGPTLSLTDNHNHGIIRLLAEDTVVTLPPQATYAWTGLPTIITLRSEFPFTLVAGAGVTINGEIAETWDCEAWPKAVALHWEAEDEWGLTGAGTVA